MNGHRNTSNPSGASPGASNLQPQPQSQSLSASAITSTSSTTSTSSPYTLPPASSTTSNRTSNRTSPFPLPTTFATTTATATTGTSMAPFRPYGVPPLSSPFGYDMASDLSHGGDRGDAAKPIGTPYATLPRPSAAPAPTATPALLRRLPIGTTKEQLRLMCTFSKDLLDIEVFPAERSRDPGFDSAILWFKSLDGAQEAQRVLDGKPNISGHANMIVEVVGDSSGPGSSGNSSATSSATSSRQPSRYNGSLRPVEKISPVMAGGAFGPADLGTPEPSNHPYWPQSPPLGNHFNERLQMQSGKQIINETNGADDDDAAGLIFNTLAFAESGSLTTQRRATAPHLPVHRLANLSLNTNTSAPPFNSPYGHPLGGSQSAHLNTVSASVMNGPGASMHYPTPKHQFHQRSTLPPANPADQNPPCNTLYVGNLPIDTSEEELKAVFGKSRGYKRLCFRTKQNGPMCFVEFEDITTATKALNELYGQPLHNSFKGGIRLSFSKNPLGVRSQQGGQGPSGPIASFGGMMPNSGNGLSRQTGPPPGLTAPPGLARITNSYTSMANGNGQNGYPGYSGFSSPPPRDLWANPHYPANPRPGPRLSPGSRQDGQNGQNGQDGLNGLSGLNGLNAQNGLNRQNGQKGGPSHFFPPHNGGR